MKGPSRKEEGIQQRGPRHDYSKENVCTIPFSMTYNNEVKANFKARKRKERQESISSLYQERKVIRSNSEERPRTKTDKSIRRVCSNEDFQKGDKMKNEIILIYEDYEYEQRRSYERFSKPFTVKSKKKNKLRSSSKSPIDVDDSRQHQIELKFLQLHAGEKDRSPSPVQEGGPPPSTEPSIDLSSLVDSSEPVLSCTSQEIDENTETLPALSVASNHLLSSPRNSIIATHRIYLDPDIQQTTFVLNCKPLSPLESKLQKVTKQINSLKKKIKKCEAEFETKHGYKVSHAEKLNDKNLRKMYVELNKLRRDQKQLNDMCPLERGMPKAQEDSRCLQNTLAEIEKRLSIQRETGNRNKNLEEMTNEELIEEKLAVQKALLILESIHGRVDNKEDRTLVRPIYDRYRLLKRMILKLNATAPDQLATIHEDETMNFTTKFPKQMSDDKSVVLTSTDSSDTDTSLNENLHSLSRTELMQQHRLVTEEKKELKRTIKMHELEVERRTGRMMQKEDRLPIEHVYTSYKKLKAKLKLLDALVGKQL